MSDNQTCPRCHRDNGCAIAAGRSESACWCTGVTITREMVARLPEEHRGVTCICAGCARELATQVLRPE